METKLYVYKLKQPFNDNVTIIFSALADSEIRAQTLILNKVSNEIYKSELKELFSGNYEPSIFDHGDVFIQLTGEYKLFTQ